jgi:hypothetical protein
LFLCFPLTLAGFGHNLETPTVLRISPLAGPKGHA